MHIRTENSWIKHFDFILVDLLCLNITFLFAYFLRMGVSNMYALSGYRMIVIVMVILHFCITYFSNLYSGILMRGYFEELKKVFTHNFILVGLLMGYMFILQTGNSYSRIILVSFLFMDTITMYLVHITWKHFLTKRGINESRKKNILVVSDAELVEEAIDKLTSGPDNSYHIAGVVLDETDRETKEVKGISVVAYGNEMFEYACQNVVDGVMICINPESRKAIEKISSKFLEMGITVHINIDMFFSGANDVHFEHINNAEVMTTSMKTASVSDVFFKRVIDICAGAVGCIITAILFIFIAPAIKIADSKGPIFFGQERAGRNGRTFKIYKFRSMYSDAEERKKELMDKNKMDGLMFKIDADPRIIGSGPDGTRKGLGHFLRATSLDEFPNFWSILKGDMSLVGTRPPTMDEYERYDLHHKSRLATKPGLTGMWQVSGRSDFTDFEEIVKLDNEYIKNWSIGLDIKIILKTVWVVVTRKGSV